MREIFIHKMITTSVIKKQNLSSKFKSKLKIPNSSYQNLSFK